MRFHFRFLYIILILMVGCRARPPPTEVAAKRPAPTPDPITLPRPAIPAQRQVAAIATVQPAANAIFLPPATPGTNNQPTLADLWAGTAHFVIDRPDTGLPMGESDTHLRSDGTMWSFFHASYESAGVVDQCGDPVPFPGCLVVFSSSDGGFEFKGDKPLTCQISCQQCPCDNDTDHVAQQQYPDVVVQGSQLLVVYEFLGRTMLRSSTDGQNWSRPERVARTGVWKEWLKSCPPEETIGTHPFVPYEYECLSGAPPGAIIVDGYHYVFVAAGQNPGGLGCYFRPVDRHVNEFRRCRHNPLFSGVNQYGPPELVGPLANPYYDFRTISSAELMMIGSGAERRFYALYEGIRGPGPADAGDSQFSLGLARSLTAAIDGPWEKFTGNPLLVDLPGNVGLGHADLLVVEGQTILYTSLDGKTRSRLVLVWK